MNYRDHELPLAQLPSPQYPNSPLTEDDQLPGFMSTRLRQLPAKQYPGSTNHRLVLIVISYRNTFLRGCEEDNYDIIVIKNFSRLSTDGSAVVPAKHRPFTGHSHEITVKQRSERDRFYCRAIFWWAEKVKFCFIKNFSRLSTDGSAVVPAIYRPFT